MLGKYFANDQQEEKEIKKKIRRILSLVEQIDC
jgi:hypothetical protein